MLSCEQVSLFDCLDLGLMTMKPGAYGTTAWFLHVVQKIFSAGGGHGSNLNFQIDILQGNCPGEHWWQIQSSDLRKHMLCDFSNKISFRVTIVSSRKVMLHMLFY